MLDQPVRWHWIVWIGIVFYIIYTGGCHRNKSVLEEAADECRRQLKGTQGAAFCDCGNRVECR